MEGTNSKKIIFGVIAVIIIIAIAVGVTSAYLTASVTSGNSINGDTYSFSMTLSITKVDPTTTPLKGSRLIPLNESDIGRAINAGCIDKNDYQVCEIYALTFQNSGSSAVTMSGNLTPQNNQFTNLYYDVTAIGEGKSALTAGTLISGLTPVTAGFSNLTIPIGSSTMYLILYIRNDQANNQPNDQARNFTGVITLTDDSGSQGRILATFTTGG